jgi:hypothetical protein
MDILDELTYEDLYKPAVDKVVADGEKSFEGNVGDVCFYDVVENKFDLASLKDSTKYDINLVNDWKTIILGVALNQEKDTGHFDILMAGFLMAEPLYLPYEYHHKDKRPYIRAYAYKMFQRYVSAFFKQCPGYEELLKLEITMPTASDMMKIQKFSDEIFSSLRVVTEPEKYQQFVDRMFDNYIYVRHTNKRIYQMKISRDADAQPDIRIPEAKISGDFMCVFRNVDIYGEYFDRLNGKLSEEEQVFFKR